MPFFRSIFCVSLFFILIFFCSVAMASGVANQVAIYKTMWATFQVKLMLSSCFVFFTSFFFNGFVYVFVVVAAAVCLSAIRFNIKNFSLSPSTSNGCWVGSVRPATIDAPFIVNTHAQAHCECIDVFHISILKRWVLVVLQLSSMCIQWCFPLSGWTAAPMQ